MNSFCLARRSGVVPHCGLTSRNADFGVTYGSCVGTMHAGRKWAGVRRVGSMQSTQPLQTARRGLPSGRAKCSAAHPLRRLLVESRGDPLLRMPAKASPDKLFQIPTPFNYLADHWENTDQSKWIDLIERQSVKGGVRDIRRDGSAHGIDDFAPADGLAANPRRDGIPVYERKRRTVVVHGDPRSTAGFRRRDYVATAHFLLFGRETSGARQFFVAVHPQAIASLSRDERDGTHCMNQSAAG